MTRRIFAVIVLYGIVPESSVSLKSLLRARSQVRPGSLDLRILLHDNSPEAVAPFQLPEGVLLHHDSSNSGIAKAYNAALSMAIKGRYEWLLTLDQDTELPENALEILLGTIAELDDRPDVGAIVPQIRAHGRIVSPNYFALGAWPNWLREGYSGIPEKQIFAFNSGSLIRVAVLRQVGGYSPWFWLDNSDSFLYRQLAKFGKRVFVEGRLEVNHSFSMMNMKELISVDRYRTILLAESAFWDMEMNSLAGLERTLRLGVRMLKHWRRHDGKPLRQLTFQTLMLRMFSTRKQRIAGWRRAIEAKFAGIVDQPVFSAEPKVSVCMATHNGERFILAQLLSIVAQLRGEDEIVIVDDASTDRTQTIIEQLTSKLASREAGPRILLLKHQKNDGVVKTFEEVLRCATGDILFLADQDDLWAPDKVQKVLRAFERNPGTQVVATGFSVIDEQDRVVEDSSLGLNRRFSVDLVANFIHNQFQGSALAIRSTFLRHILPFPAGRLFLHDRWIGARALLRKANTHYIDEPLLQYREHEANYTRRFNRSKQVLLRMQLLGDLLRLHRHQL